MRNIDGSIEAYIEYIREKGVSVLELSEEVSRVYEASRLIKRHDGSSVIIYKVKEYPWKFVSNLIPSRDAFYKVLGANSDVEAYKALEVAQNTRGTLVRGDFSEFFNDIEPELGNIPALKYYELDGGLYLSSSIFVACYENVCNSSFHRVMVNLTEGYAAVRVVPRHLYTLMSKAKGSIPVAVVIGVDARIGIASALSPPLGVFELEIAASLLGGELRVCRTPLHGLPVPCGASMVVEGRLGPERGREGPFTDLLNLYDSVRNEPLLHVERIYVNKVYEPIIHAILPGGSEHMLLMGFPREAMIYSAVSRSVPHVVKVRLTPGGGMWLHAVISIIKQHEGDGKTAGLAALAAHPSLKHVVVVDEDIDPDNPLEVEWAIATRFQAHRGLVVVPHARGSTLDPSSSEGLTSKIIIDATAPLSDKDKYRRPRIPL